MKNLCCRRPSPAPDFQHERRTRGAGGSMVPLPGLPYWKKFRHRL